LSFCHAFADLLEDCNRGWATESALGETGRELRHDLDLRIEDATEGLLAVGDKCGEQPDSRTGQGRDRLCVDACGGERDATCGSQLCLNIQGGANLDYTGDRDQTTKLQHNRAVLGSATKMRKTRPPSYENSANPQLEASRSATQSETLQTCSFSRSMTFSHSRCHVSQRH
jgi:hypothetical protein